MERRPLKTLHCVFDLVELPFAVVTGMDPLSIVSAN